jgi:hypothetical protein
VKSFVASPCSWLAATRLHAGHERVAKPAGANGKGVHGDAQSRGQVAAAFDALPPRVAVVLNGQVALFGPQLFQAAVEAVETLCLNRDALVGFDEPDAAGSGDVGVARVVVGNKPAVTPEVFQEDESRDHVAVAGRRPRGDDAGLLQGAGNAIEGVVHELIRIGAIPPIEVRDQPAAHLEVTLAVGVDTIVQPLEQPPKCELRKDWSFSKGFLTVGGQTALCE